MRSQISQVILLSVSLIPMIAAGQPGSKSSDQKYAGTWSGSYTMDNGGTGNLSFVFSKDEKGQWRGTAKWSNQDGEKKAELKPLRIADGNISGKVESPDGQVEVSIEGKLQQDQLEGTYAVSPKGSTEVAEKGTWKVSKGAPQKTAK